MFKHSHAFTAAAQCFRHMQCKPPFSCNMRRVCKLSYADWLHDTGMHIMLIICIIALHTHQRICCMALAQAVAMFLMTLACTTTAIFHTTLARTITVIFHTTLS